MEVWDLSTCARSEQDFEVTVCNRGTEVRMRQETSLTVRQALCLSACDICQARCFFEKWPPVLIQDS